jgi:nucleotide-binding universal stress UspA family protein
MTPSPGRFQSILVPLDGSLLAEQAIPVALAIAERARSKIKLVLVHQPLLLDVGAAYTNMELMMEKADRDYLRSVAARVRAGLGRALSSAVLQGPIVQTLTSYVRELSIDLVVMTTHGRGGIRRAWLGSVTDQLIRTLDVPVLAVRAREDGSGEPMIVPDILVPLDGSPLAEAVLEPAAAMARLWDAELTLVQIVQPVLLTTEPALPFPSGYDEQLTNMERDAAQDYLHDIAERLRNQGVKASGVAVLGGATANTVLDMARPDRVGMVALATHGRGSIRRLVLGSVADKLVRAAEVPVLVVRPSPVKRRVRQSPKHGAARLGMIVVGLA